MVSMGVVWDRTAEFLSDNITTLLPIVLLTIFAPTMVAGNLDDVRAGAGAGLIATLQLGSLILSLVALWGQLAITALAIDPALGREANGVATRRFLPAVLVLVVMLVCALLLLAPVWVILAANGVNSAAMAAGRIPTVPPSATWSLALYLLIALPLALWLAARVMVLSVPVVVAERRALGALPRAYWLTRGVALKIIGVLVLYAVVALVAGLAARTVFGSIFQLIIGDADAGMSLATVLTSIIVAAVSTAFTVLSVAFSAKLYVALSARDEARRP